LCINAQEAQHPNQPSFIKRKASKRRLIDSDEEEVFDDPADPRVKRARTAESDHASTAQDYNGVDHDMDVDVDGEMDVMATDEETRFLAPDAISQLAAAPPSVAPGQARKNSRVDVCGKHFKGTGPGNGAKKKKQVMFSDAEDAEVDINDVVDEDDVYDEPFADDPDDDFEPEHPPKRSGKANASSSTKSKTAKVKPPLAKGGKGKAGKEKDKGIMIKDERKLHSPPSLSTAQTQASDLFADDQSSAPQPSVGEPSAAPDHSTLPPPEPPKKRKLPTIKKNKPPGSATTSTLPQSATLPPKPPPPTDDVTKIIAPLNQQRKPAGLSGATDFDLRDKSVYAELFKGVRGV